MTHVDPRFDFVSQATIIVKNPPKRAYTFVCAICGQRRSLAQLVRVPLDRCPMNGADTAYDVLVKDEWRPVFGANVCEPCVERRQRESPS